MSNGLLEEDPCQATDRYQVRIQDHYQDQEVTSSLCNGEARHAFVLETPKQQD